VAVDGNGNITICGSFSGKADFGGGGLTSAGLTDIFVASYSPGGAHRWSKRFGGAHLEEGFAVVVDSSGNVTVTGRFRGTVDFGGGPMTSGHHAAFIVSFTSDGAHRWSKQMTGGSYSVGHGLAVDAGGNVTTTGDFEGVVDFSGGQTGPLVGAGNADYFVTSFTNQGGHRWSKRGGGTGNETGMDAAVDASGNVFTTGWFNGAADFGGGVLTSSGGQDIFVASHTSVGVFRWAKQLGGTGGDIGFGVVVDASGNVFTTGSFTGAVDFGGGVLTTSGANDIFVASYTSGGVYRWAKQLGGIGADVGFGVAVDGGDLFATGSFQGTADFGGGGLTSVGMGDIFVASYTSDGMHRWSRGFGGSTKDDGRRLALDNNGNVAITGNFAGTADFGGGSVNSSGGDDVFLLVHRP
jgi:hypothetical protein